MSFGWLFGQRGFMNWLRRPSGKGRKAVFLQWAYDSILELRRTSGPGVFTDTTTRGVFSRMLQQGNGATDVQAPTVDFFEFVLDAYGTGLAGTVNCATLEYGSFPYPPGIYNPNPPPFDFDKHGPDLPVTIRFVSPYPYETQWQGGRNPNPFSIEDPVTISAGGILQFNVPLGLEHGGFQSIYRWGLVPKTL